MQKIFVAHDPVEANFVKDLLERAGIAAEIQGEYLFGLRPHIGFADETLLPSVWITEDEQIEAALALIDDYERRKRINLT